MLSNAQVNWCVVRWRDLLFGQTAPRNQTLSFPLIRRKPPAVIPSVPQTRTQRRLDHKVKTVFSSFRTYWWYWFGEMHTGKYSVRRKVVRLNMFFIILHRSKDYLKSQCSPVEMSTGRIMLFCFVRHNSSGGAGRAQAHLWTLRMGRFCLQI